MATTDNKVLTGAGVEQLSQLVKNAIAQGGGTEYTAGSGISISDNDKISLNYFPVGLNHMTALARGYTDHTWMIKTYSTKEEVVAGLSRGEVVFSVANARLSQGSFGIIESRAMLFYVEVGSSGIGYTTDMYNNDIAIFYKYLYLMDNILFVSKGITKEQFIESLIKDGIYYNNSTSGLTAKGVGSAIDELAAKIPSIATTETPGTVIPDGTTITIDSNGVISSQGGGAEYTAGPGIEISSENEISRTAGQTLSPILLGGLQGLTNSDIITLLSNNLPQATDADTFISLCKEQVLFNNTYGEGWTGSQFTAFKNSLGVQNLRKISISGDGSVNVSAIQYYFNPDYVYYLFEKIGTVGYFYTVGNLYNLKYLPNAIQYDNTTSSLAATTMKNAIDELATKIPTLATTQTAGIVKPDGTTITVDENGVISSQGGGSSLPSDPVVDGSYKLVNTVATVEGTQTATQSWQEDAGYTAGSGIEIDSNNVIMLKKALQRFDGVESLENVDLVGVPSLNYYNNPTTDQINAFAADVVRLGGGYIFTVSMNSTKMNTLQAAFQNALGLSYTPRIAINDSTNHDGLNINPNSPQRVPNNNTRFYIKPIYNGWTGLMACSWVESGKPVGNMGMNFDRYSVSDLKTYFEATVDTTPYGSYWLASDLISRAIQHTNFSSLSSTDTAPTVNNTINWVYK